MLETTIENVHIYRYSIPFNTPLQVGPRTLETREGIILSLTDADGLAGYGEIAPLDGYSGETLERAQQQILNAAPKLLTMKLMSQVTRLSGHYYPSVSFGIDTAAVNLMNQRLRSAFPAPAHLPTPREIPVNALLETTDNSTQAIEQELERLITGGFKTIKIKIARTGPAEDSQRINRILTMLPDSISVRLDANRKWSFGQAITFAKSIETGKQLIEYIEEPFDWKTIGQLEQYHRDTGLPTALDESLADGAAGLAAIRPGKGISALILKPTLLGGIERITSLIAQAKQRGLAAIISSCFETGPGFIELCKMAATLDAGPGAFGLDTLKYLRRTLLQRPIAIENGCISLDVESMAQYNFEQLETIYP